MRTKYRQVMIIVDLHTHILPCIDDGSASADESEKMLTLMGEQGIDVVAATPHFDMRRETVDGFLKRREKSLRMLENKECYPKIILGVEVLCSELQFHFMKSIEKLCIASTGYMLVETHMTYWTETMKNELLKIMYEHGITPVLAHIERYCSDKRGIENIRELKKNGAILQMNAGGFLTRASKKAALRLLVNENVDLVCSDCHGISVRPPNLAEAMKEIRAHAGDEVAERLMHNARLIAASYV